MFCCIRGSGLLDPSFGGLGSYEMSPVSLSMDSYIYRYRYVDIGVHGLSVSQSVTPYFQNWLISFF